MKYDSKTKTMDYTKKEREHVFSSFPKGKSTPRSKALKSRKETGVKSTNVIKKYYESKGKSQPD
jgi:hypothetical protein